MLESLLLHSRLVENRFLCRISLASAGCGDSWTQGPNLSRLRLHNLLELVAASVALNASLAAVLVMVSHIRVCFSDSADLRLSRTLVIFLTTLLQVV